MRDRPQLSWGVRRTQGMRRRHGFALPILMAVLAACARHTHPVVIDPESAIEPMPPCPAFDTIPAVLRQAATRDVALDSAGGRLAIVVTPLPFPAIIDQSAGDSTRRTFSDSLGRASLRVSADSASVVRVRAFAHHTAYYRVRPRRGFTDTLVVTLKACV